MAESAPTTKGNVDKGYDVPTAEKDLVHVQLEVRSFNAVTGEKTSTPFVQKFYPKEFDAMETAGHFKGYSVDVLHDPRRAADMKAGKIAAAVASPVQSATLDKPLDEMSKAELQIKYAELYKEQPPAGDSEQDLRDAIEDKLIELRGTEISGHLDEANEQSKGALNDGINTPSEQTQATNEAMDSLSEAASKPTTRKK